MVTSADTRTKISGDVDQTPPGEQSTPSSSDQSQQKSIRRRAARRTEQILLLSLAIICAAVGFPFHVLWLVAIGLMVLLWAYMAADIGGSRRGGGMISDVVTSISDEVQNLTKEAPEISASDGVSDGAEEMALPTSPTEDAAQGSRTRPDAAHEKKATESNANDDSTKKELYEEARQAGIEGRSTMNKEELHEALDEQAGS
jgi:hypothetical protein